MATTAVDIVVKVVGGNKLDRFQKQLNKTDQIADRLNGNLPNASNNIRKVGSSANNASKGVQALNKAFFAITATVTAVAGAVKLFNASVERTESERRIKILADAYGETAQVLEAAERSADKFGQSQTEVNKALANTFSRLRPVGVGLEDIVSTYNGFQTAARISGATAQESAAAFTQLAQALGSGRLAGDEFRSIAEQAPLLLQAISKETGVAVGQLKDYAAEGLITSQVVIAALKKIETEGADQLADSLKGPQQALKNVAVAAEDLFAALGKIGEGALVSAADGITASIKTITDNLDLLAPLAENVFAALTAAARGFAAGLSSALPQVNNFGNKVREVISVVVIVLGDLARTIESVASFIGRVVGGIVSFIAKAGSAIVGSVAETGQAVVQNISNAVRAAARIIAGFVNAIGGLGAGILKLFGIDLGEVVATPLFAIADGIDAVEASVGNYITSVKQRAAELNFGGGFLPEGGSLSSSTFAPQTPDGGGRKGGRKGRKGKNAADEFKKTEERIAALLRRATELGETFSGILAVESTPLQEEIGDIRDEILSADKALEKLLIDFDKLAQGDPRFDGARSQISAIRGRLAEFSDEDIKRTASERLTQGDREGFEKAIREAEALNAALREGRTELTAVEQLTVKYGEDWEALDPAVRQHLTNLAETKDALEAQNEALAKQKAELDSLYEGIGNTIQTGIIDAIDAGITALIDGTKDLDDALKEIASGVLRDIGRQLISFGINSALSGLGGGDGVGVFSKLFPQRANGGPVTAGQPYLIGERGPELMVPSQSGTVIPNEQMSAAMSRYSQTNGRDANNTPTFRLETTVINGVEYATVEQVRAMGQQAARQGAAAGTARTMSNLKNNRSTRSKLGM